MHTLSPGVNVSTSLDCCGSVRTVEVGPLALALDALLVHYGDEPATSCPMPTPAVVSHGIVCALCGSFVGWVP